IDYTDFYCDVIHDALSRMEKWGWSLERRSRIFTTLLEKSKSEGIDVFKLFMILKDDFQNLSWDSEQRHRFFISLIERTTSADSFYLAAGDVKRLPWSGEQSYRIFLHLAEKARSFNEACHALRTLLFILEKVKWDPIQSYVYIDSLIQASGGDAAFEL